MRALTPKMIRDAIDYLRSDEYAQRSMEKQQIRCNAETIVIKAYQQNKISLENYYRYMTNIALNGMLLLHPKDKNKKILNRVVKQLEKCHTQTKK